MEPKFDCDQSPVTIEISVEEHEYLMDILCNVADCYNFVLSSEDIMHLPEDSEAVKRYKMLRSLRDQVNRLWTHRFIHNCD